MLKKYLRRQWSWVSERNNRNTPGSRQLRYRSMRSSFDIAVIGAGIAGASVAAALAKHASVILIEKEQHPGYHSTGRSAAMYIPSYGPPMIQTLTRASGDFLHNPPPGFSTTPLLGARAEMLIARKDQLATIDAFMQQHSADTNIQLLNSADIRRQCPLLKTNYAASAILDTSGSDINVNALHQGYLANFKASGGVLITGGEVKKLKNQTSAWSVETTTEKYTTGIVVNAAGAWADEIGSMAKVETIGLVAKRRTALTIDVPTGINTKLMPLVADIDEAFYVKPEAGTLLLSPANEDPIQPCDVQPEELDIAICIDEIEKAFDIQVTTIKHKWAGLRSFVSDNEPVAGYSEKTNNFFWLAGQGGYGIQSSPALSRYAASVILGNEIPTDLISHGIDHTDRLGPKRLNSNE